ncbi:putative transcriptional regulator [Saccharolobus solfataricus rod-shaped virus 1]|uniref:Putative transcriptional regulator n=1 Tax=Saccharolobus solfataricus rod-shaped virus 1 TaxID=2730619 RepID=A0A6M3VYC1_SSRV1|nr:putative transcriptional regulator [Saccharolobus solfataricus rod-shaped virus 1]QJF12281.1 putative transcriptional regulator [Saccharolobus solfataricus rod-shaped virus 1]
MKNPSRMVSVRVSKSQYEFFLMYKEELKEKLLEKLNEMQNINIKLKPTKDKEIYDNLISFRIPYQYFQKIEEIAEKNQAKISDIVRNILFNGE